MFCVIYRRFVRTPTQVVCEKSLIWQVLTGHLRKISTYIDLVPSAPLAARHDRCVSTVIDQHIDQQRRTLTRSDARCVLLQEHPGATALL